MRANPATAVAGLTGDQAFSRLARWTEPVDWDAVPSRLDLADGAWITFDKRRRSAQIEHTNGGVTVFDLGRPDRMRSAGQILTSGLTRQDGPSLDATPGKWVQDSGEVAVRDPLDAKGKRAPNFSSLGPQQTFRFVDGDGRPQLVGYGEVETVTGFGTFTMSDGAAYAHLCTTSGLGCFYDAPRAGFMKAVTAEIVEQARAEGFAPVVTKAGPIGVVFDCGAPGDYLALSIYGGEHGGTVGTVVDLRRPPVKDGAIVDP